MKSSMDQKRIKRRPQSVGMTLVELLVVVGVMLILLGVALPVLKTGLQDRKLREASRIVSAQVAVAKAKAAELGRPVALCLEVEQVPETASLVPVVPWEPSSAPHAYASKLYIAETPTPYIGDFDGAAVRIATRTPPPPGSPYQELNFEPLGSSTMVSVLGVEAGDFIRLNYKGPYYIVGGIMDASGALRSSGRIEAETDRFRIVGSPLPSDGLYRYQIYRKPRKSSSTPVTLPGSAVIDLECSGYGLTDRSFGRAVWPSLGQPNRPLLIEFNPSGDVNRVIINGVAEVPTDTIHLLIGTVESVAVDGVVTTFGVKYNENLENPANQWISIGHLTGRVTTAQNAWITSPTFNESITYAREFAQTSQSVGGQ